MQEDVNIISAGLSVMLKYMLVEFLIMELMRKQVQTEFLILEQHLFDRIFNIGILGVELGTSPREMISVR